MHILAPCCGVPKYAGVPWTVTFDAAMFVPSFAHVAAYAKISSKTPLLQNLSPYGNEP